MFLQQLIINGMLAMRKAAREIVKKVIITGSSRWRAMELEKL